MKSKLIARTIKATVSPYKPILAQLVVTSKCNLSCSYCFEFNNDKPLPTINILNERIDKLSKLGTLIVTITGGEPLLIKDVCKVIERVTFHGMIATLNTNAYLLDEKTILDLNKAGLKIMQISIDNFEPDAISQKSFNIIQKQLETLAKFAKFKVNISTVLYSQIDSQFNISELNKQIKKLGFSHSVSLAHDENGKIIKMTKQQKIDYEQFEKNNSSKLSKVYSWLFQKKLANGENNHWKCRAGSRYLYVSDEGNVHRCAQQLDKLSIPLLDFSKKHIIEEFNTHKSCTNGCTLNCVRMASAIDKYR